MSRINKIVAKRKSEENESGHNNPLNSRENITANNQQFNYTQTKVVPVTDEELIKNRVIARDPKDPRATKFQILRTKILQQMRKKSWNALAISAPTPGAGKSLIAANLAASIALEGNQSVMLVDMDLRNPSLHKYFSIRPENGLHDCLDGTVGVEEALVNPGIDRLVLLPGRRGVLNSSEQISTPYVQSMVKEIKNRYQSRLVIFDLPPVLVSDDVMVFLPYVDCSLLVVESGKNTTKDIEDAVDVIKSIPFLGTVLNKCENLDENLIY